MSRVFIAPLGFHEDILLRSLIAFRVNRSDVVYAVTCKPVVGAVKKAFDTLVALSGKQGFPPPMLVDLDCNNFYDSIRVIRGIVKRHESNDMVLCIGGGLRALTLITLIALIASEKPFTLHYEPEAGTGEFTIDQKFFLNIFRKLSGIEKKTLSIIISKPGVTVKELSETLGFKEKTVRNTVTKLKKRGLVIKRGRREGVEPTEVAIALFS